MDGIEYALDLFLVCDMKCLVEVLGLYSTFHPKAKWKCPWCLVHSSNIADFTILQWELRDLQGMKATVKTRRANSEQAKQRFAKDHHGIKVKLTTSILHSATNLFLP